MKLLAAINDTHVVFSVSHYDCRGRHGLMADGGQPGLQNYAGYTRFSHMPTWIELPGVDFAQLTNDYNRSLHRKRRYGVHKLSSVRILSKGEIPDTDSFEWQLENAVWGTNGPNGDKPLNFVLLTKASTDHLQAILDTCGHIYKTPTEKIIKAILEARNVKR